MTLVSEALLDAMVRYANTAQAVREYGVSCCTPRRAARLGQRSALGREIAPRLSAHLEQPGGPHATADAHADDNVLYAPAPAFEQRMADQPCPGHAEGVADGDGAAVDVEPVVRDA